MAAYILTINKRKWIAGLSWSLFQERPSKDDIRDIGEIYDADWYALRIGEGAIQAGYCAEVVSLDSSRVRPGNSASLAAAVADIKPQPWLGIFRIAEGLWWYIAVRDGNAVLANGDVIGDQAAIEAIRDEHAGLGDWQYLEGDLQALETLLADAKREKQGIWKRGASPAILKPIQPPTLMPYAVAGGVAAAGVAGWLWWHNDQVAYQQKVRASILAQQRAAHHHVVRAPKWPTQASPSAFLSACVSHIGAVPLSVSGWEPKSMSCQLRAGPKPEATASILWIRTKGSTAAHRPRGVLSADGQTVNQVMSFQIPETGMPAPQSHDEGLGAARNKFWAVTETLGLQAQLALPMTNATLPGQKRKAEGSQVLHARLGFPVEPTLRDGMALDNIPGLRLTALSLSTADGRWQARGELHGSDAATNRPPVRSIGGVLSRKVSSFGMPKIGE